MVWAIAETSGFLLGMSLGTYPGNDVLKHSQWTYHAAIDASEDDGQCNKEHHYSHVDSQYSWQELQLCHPSEPQLCRAREVKKQPSQSQKKDRG